jgi:hypothetical protein
MHGRVAIALGGGSVQKLRAIPARNLKHVARAHRAHHQRLNAYPRIVYGTCGRGEVEHIVHSARVEGLTDIVLEQLKPGLARKVRNIGPRSGGEVIDAQNTVALRKQRVG